MHTHTKSTTKPNAKPVQRHDDRQITFVVFFKTKIWTNQKTAKYSGNDAAVKTKNTHVFAHFGHFHLFKSYFWIHFRNLHEKLDL